MGNEHEQLRPATLVAAQNLRVDALIVDVVGALRGAGIEPIVLKGPSTPHWLGADGARTYLDCDLLVSPGDQGTVERVLGELGFRRYLDGVDLGERWLHSAVAWGRAEDELVDVHESLDGVTVPPDELWERLSGHTVELTLGRTAVTILDRPATALTIALHAAQHGKDADKPLGDLAAALERLDAPTWAAAAALAAELGATPAFAAGLSLLPAGRATADSLALSAERPTAVVLAAESAPPAAFTLEHLATRRGLRGKLAFIAGRAFPPAAFVRENYPFARRGRAALAAVYAARFVAAPVRLVRAAPGWRRARKLAAASHGHPAE